MGYILINQSFKKEKTVSWRQKCSTVLNITKNDAGHCFQHREDWSWLWQRSGVWEFNGLKRKYWINGNSDPWQHSKEFCHGRVQRNQVISRSQSIVVVCKMWDIKSCSMQMLMLIKENKFRIEEGAVVSEIPKWLSWHWMLNAVEKVGAGL